MLPKCHSCQDSLSGGWDVSSWQNLKCVLRSSGWVAAVLPIHTQIYAQHLSQEQRAQPTDPVVYLSVSRSLSLCSGKDPGGVIVVLNLEFPSEHHHWSVVWPFCLVEGVRIQIRSLPLPHKNQAKIINLLICYKTKTAF